jgi:hypothetical protein
MVLQESYESKKIRAAFRCAKSRSTAALVAESTLLPRRPLVLIIEPHNTIAAIWQKRKGVPLIVMRSLRAASTTLRKWIPVAELDATTARQTSTPVKRAALLGASAQPSKMLTE